MAKCKSCGGNNAKKLSIIEKEGTTTTNMGKVVLGAGNVTNKTQAAKEAAFKSESSDTITTLNTGIGCLLALFGPVFIMGFLLPPIENDLVFGLIFFPLFILIYFLWMEKSPLKGAEEKEMTQYSKEIDKWERTWMCLDCGHKWVGRK